MRSFSLVALALILPLSACGGDDKPEEPTAFDSMQEAARGLESMAEEMERRAEEAPADPVDFQVLKELLPERLAGFTRTESSGSRRRMGEGFGVSEAEAAYADESGSETLEVEIVDLAGAGPFGMMAGFGLGLAAEYEEETDTGYRRSREIRGHRGYEEYDSEDGDGEMAVLVADRFMVKVEGSDVEMNVIEQAITSIDLGALEKMKDEGR